MLFLGALAEHVSRYFELTERNWDGLGQGGEAERAHMRKEGWVRYLWTPVPRKGKRED